MELQNIKKVVEINGAKYANQYVALGWVILNTVAQREGDSGWITYSLGWPNALPANEPE